MLAFASQKLGGYVLQVGHCFHHIEDNRRASTLFATHTGFEPVTSSVTGKRALRCSNGPCLWMDMVRTSSLIANAMCGVETAILFSVIYILSKYVLPSSLLTQVLRTYITKLSKKNV